MKLSSFLLLLNQVFERKADSFTFHPGNNRRKRIAALELSNKSSDEETEFQPSFDGQLFYGLSADKETNQITTTVEELQEIRVRRGLHTVDGIDDNNKNNNNTEFEFEEKVMVHEGKKLNIRSRTVPVADRRFQVWELSKPQAFIETWMMRETNDNELCSDDDDADPFGCVMWPGSIVASEELLKLPQEMIRGKIVLVLGAGTGLEALAAAECGASKVIATDFNMLTLALMCYAADNSNFSHVIETQFFDIFSSNPLPICDIVVAADMLYNPELAMQVGKRCSELLRRQQPRPYLIVTDSQRFHGTDFVSDLNAALDNNSIHVKWIQRQLNQVTASGVMIDQDQTYDVTVRMLHVQEENGADTLEC